MKIIHKLGLPYMGSKRRLAKPILGYILKHNPNTKYLYDVFGGGGAISYEAIQRSQIKQVFYNDFNTSITELLKKIQKDGVTKEMYMWVDRETFKEHKDDNTWYGGFLTTVWSFGNHGYSYLYGKEIEYDKRLLHKIIVDKCVSSMVEFNNKFGIDIEINNSFIHENVHQRRLRIMKYIKTLNLQNLQRLQRLENLQRLQRLENLQRLQRLENLQRLQRLERLQNLEHIQQFHITNKSYENVKITTPKEETIIYLDPPYEDTEEYKTKMTHDNMYKWIYELAKQGYKIYLSSYKSPLYLIKEFEHSCTFYPTSNKKVIERLFSNTKDISEKIYAQGTLF